MPPAVGVRLRSVRLAAGLAALAPLGGCVSTSKPSLTPPLPLEVIAVERIKTPSHDVPVPVISTEPETSTFTAADAVAFALQHNPRLIAVRAEMDRAGAEIDVAASPLLPHIDWLTRSIITSPNQGAGAPGLTGAVLVKGTHVTNLFVQSELQLQWTLIDFGRTAGRVGESEAKQRAAAARLARAEQTIALDATTVYLQVLLAEAGERTQRNALKWAEIFLADARTRRKAGTADKNDDLRAEVLKAAEADRLTEAQRQVANAAAGLNNALGRNPSLAVKLAPWDSLPPLERPIGDCLNAAVERRPEVAISRDLYSAAIAARQSRNAAYNPRIYTLASTGYIEGQNVVNGIYGGSGIHFDMPLYDGGLRRGELRAADAEVVAAGANARKVFDDVALQVHLAYQDAVAAAERAKLSRPAVEQGREYLRLTLVKYKNGDSTPADIADAEATATRAEDRYHAAAYEYLAALARLGYATGEGPQAYLQETPKGLPEPDLLPKPAVLPPANAPK